MSKEQIEAAAKLLAEAADSIEEWAAYADPYFQNKHDLQGDLVHYRAEAGKLVAAAQLDKAPEPVAWIERRFANGELVLETVKLQKMPDDLRENLALHYDLEIVPLYTAPPDVAELQKQVQDLITQNTDYLERLRDVSGHYEAASKANEQAHVALAESQHKVTDLEKQVQALQAEIEQLKGNK